MNTRTVLAVTFAGLAACGSSNPGDTTGTTGPTGSTGPGQAAVNVQLQGSGAVDVVTQTGAQTCQGSCTTQVVQGSTVLLVPHAGNGFSFQGFQGNLCNGSAVQGSNDCNLTVNGDLTVIIMFQALPPPPPSQQTLAVNRTGNGVCVVVATSIGLDCGTDCQRDVAAGLHRLERRLRRLQGSHLHRQDGSEPDRVRALHEDRLRRGSVIGRPPGHPGRARVRAPGVTCGRARAGPARAAPSA